MDGGDVEFESRRQRVQRNGIVDAGESKQVRAKRLFLDFTRDHREDVRALKGKKSDGVEMHEESTL